MPRRSAKSLGSVFSARGRAVDMPAPPSHERISAREDGESSSYHRRSLGLFIQVLVVGSCMTIFFIQLGRHVLSYFPDASSSDTGSVLVRAAGLGGCIVTLVLCVVRFLIRDTLSKRGASNDQLIKVDDILTFVGLLLLGAIAGPCGLVILQAAFGQDSVLTVRMVSFMGVIGYGVFMFTIGFLVLSASAILGLEVIWQTSRLIFN